MRSLWTLSGCNLWMNEISVDLSGYSLWMNEISVDLRGCSFVWNISFCSGCKLMWILQCTA